MGSDDIVALELPREQLGQIIDGLCARRDSWRVTQEYLESGYIDIEQGVEECSDPERAKNIADYYNQIIETMRQQLIEE